MNTKLFVFSILIACFGIHTSADKPCMPRAYNHSSIVCVCNATYCDEISKIQKLESNQYVIYSSDLEGKRFEKVSGSINVNSANNFAADDDVVLQINRDEEFQAVFGFGGSFTDAAGINILSLSESVQNKLIDSYFSENGLEFNMGRVPIGGCDFSTHPYAYNMLPEDDLELSNFSLTMEDFEFKLPFIRKAMEIATDDIYLIGTAWSPPLWMKTNHAIGGESRLIAKYYQTWADYHLKFLEEYDKNGVLFWALTTGNEPSNGVIPVMGFNSLGWMPEEQSKWLTENYGPTLRQSKYSNITILALDDQRISLPWWIERMAKTDGAMDYISGVAVHWYWNDFVSPRPIEQLHSQFPDKYFVSTEACIGDKPWQLEKVELGSWKRAEMYVKDIMQDLNHWHAGWVDWNLVLNRIGGPNWIENYVDAAVIALPEQDEFVKQPIFYALGHFSKFIPRNSKKVSVEKVSGEIDSVALKRPDGGITVVLYNPSEINKKVIIKEANKGYIEIDVPKRSIHSLIYW